MSAQSITRIRRRTFWPAALAGLALAALRLHAEAPLDWARLSQQVESRRVELADLINRARVRGMTTDYAAVSKQVIVAFQTAARHDHDHLDRVRTIFQSFGYYDQIAPSETDELPVKELKDCLLVADHAIAELRGQLNQEITLSTPPDFSQGRLVLGKRYYRLNGEVVFPSSLVWMPKEEGYMQAFGRIGETYYHLGNLREDLSLGRGTLDRAVASLTHQCDLDAAPLVFFLGHSPAGWMKNEHPEILEGARHFTPYDIDSPLIREWITRLCRGFLPAVSQVGGQRPRMHLLANEPHFATQRGGWRANNGLSEFSLQKYRRWLATKYPSVDAMNELHQTSYRNFDEVKVDLPIDPALRGTAFWYDWCRFNMDRVNEWFTFLKDQVQANDPNRSPVTIKMLGFTLSTPLRDHGLDLEYLTKLQDVPGADLRVAPRDATFFGKHEEGLNPETGWRSRYAYDWVEQSMYLDFTKSLCPDKLFYDSEWHGFGAVSWRHFDLDRDYVRSALWLAFTHGMGAIKPWLWGRDEDGALRSQADHIGELSTQPVALDAYGRTMKELNAHAEKVAALVPHDRRFLLYYCEEAAIQDPQYTAGFKTLYEALKLLNLPAGFTTPSEIGKLAPRSPVVLVPPTRFISDASLAALRAFQEAGGRVVLTGGKDNFLKTEMGVARVGDGVWPPQARLPLESIGRMVPALEQALVDMAAVPAVATAIRDEAGQRAWGVIIQQAADPATGRPLVVLNNVSRAERTVTLNSGRGSFVDVVTGVPLGARLTLKPCEVRLLSQDR